MRFVPHTQQEVREMLESVGASSINSLFSDIPQDKKIASLSLQSSKSEFEVVSIMNRLAERNRPAYEKPAFLGAGAYRHFVPSVVDAVLSRSEFYTAYTPYQAEASQGVLQSIFEYQTLICRLTGMDVSNASHYDGATACTEAAVMAINESRKSEILYSAALHPEYVEVLKTYFRNGENVILREIPLDNGTTSVKKLNDMLGKDTAGVIIQNPNCLGFIEPAVKIGEAIKTAKIKGLYIIAVTEPHSLGILKTPGDCGADIAVGEGAGLGIPVSFGGPFLGFMACKTKYLRKMPGRLVGKTLDEYGKTAYCLTLQTREQHIRREKALSNICSNEALCALAATVYLSYVGRRGFVDLAKRNLEKAHYLKGKLMDIPGFKMFADKAFFNEFTVKCPDDPVKIENFLRERGITPGFRASRWKNEWKDCMIFCVTEMNTHKEINDLVGFLETYCKEEVGSGCTRA